MSRQLSPSGRDGLGWAGEFRAQCSRGADAATGMADGGGASCPRLGEAGHGSWYFSMDLPRRVDGERRRLRRGGYLTSEAADAARARLSVPVKGDQRDGVYTVAEWLEAWVETRARLRDSTRRIYKSHVRQHLRRVLGGVLLELDAGRVGQAFARLLGEGMSAAIARRGVLHPADGPERRRPGRLDPR
jgi:hypothetical protein